MGRSSSGEELHGPFQAFMFLICMFRTNARRNLNWLKALGFPTAAHERGGRKICRFWEKMFHICVIVFHITKTQTQTSSARRSQGSRASVNG